LATQNDEERRLETAYSEAAEEYSRAVSKLADARRSLPKAEYLKVQREAEIARLGSEAALMALETLRAGKAAGRRN
jgi:hypothetical protein